MHNEDLTSLRVEGISKNMGSSREEREPCGAVKMQQWLCHHSAKTTSK